MVSYAIAPPAQTLIPIMGSDDMFPVRRIYCVGQNYAKHIAEMGGRPEDRKPPFFFQKPNDAIVICRPEDKAKIAYPKITDDLHHEVEMVIAIGKGGEFIKSDNAAEHIFGLGVGIDLTRRDRQREMKSQSRSWEIAKAFDDSAPVSAITPVGVIPDNAQITLKVNGEIRQDGNIKDMIWNAAEIVSGLSHHYTLMPGDIILSGTPEGVGPIVRGDKVEARLKSESMDLGELIFTLT